MYFLFRLPVRVLLLLFALLCSLVRQRLWITVELMISASDCCLHRAELLRLNRNFAVRFLSEMITRGVCRFYFPRNCLPKRFQSDIYSISFFSCCCFFFGLCCLTGSRLFRYVTFFLIILFYCLIVAFNVSPDTICYSALLRCFFTAVAAAVVV